MFDTMYEAEGVGLAAPQIGLNLRLFVMDCEDTKLIAANPEIIHTEGEQAGQEGCLSVGKVPAVFEPRAEVTSRVPSTEQGQTAQRRRWEHGHLATILAEAPRLAREAFRQRRADLFGMALDLTIPPLSFFILALAALVILAAGLQFWGAQGIALALSASAAGLAGLSLLAAWYVFGRDLLSAGDLAAIPCYVARKIPLYVSAFYARERQWVRSSRRNGDGGC
jgi:hypothetical protein